MAGGILLHLLYVVEEQAIKENSTTMKELRENINSFNLTNKQFVRVFRLSKDAVIYLCDELRCILQRRGRKGISVETQILAVLWFFTIGFYQRGIGNDYLISLSQPAISKAIKAVAVGTTELLAKEWFKFPTQSKNEQL